jgi:N-acyl amino acid synthase of PEP-CTERM/exosortase system
VPPQPPLPDLGERFRQRFELTAALEHAAIEQVFRIRHDVYCRDLGWEPVRADGREVDEFDAHSFHCLLRTRDTAEPVGCARLILTRPEDPGHPLPFEDSCIDVLDRSLADPQRMPRGSLGEVSRLAVLKSYRRRKGEDLAPASLADDDFAPRGRTDRFPFIPVSLFLGAAAIARRFDVEHVFVLTEPRLASHFARIGFDIRTVGGPVEHHGTRVPSLLSSSKVVQGLRPMIRPLYAVIEQAVEDAFRTHPDGPASAAARRR